MLDDSTTSFVVIPYQLRQQIHNFLVNLFYDDHQKSKKTVEVIRDETVKTLKSFLSPDDEQKLKEVQGLDGLGLAILDIFAKDIAILTKVLTDLTPQGNTKENYQTSLSILKQELNLVIEQSKKGKFDSDQQGVFFMNGRNIDKAKLREYIVDSFSEAEFKIFCDDLAGKYPQLKFSYGKEISQNLSFKDKVHEVIQLFERRKILNFLAQAIMETQIKLPEQNKESPPTN